MPNQYSLTIKNQTGGFQDYAFFSAPPVVSGAMSGEIWSNVLKSSPSTASGGRATLDVWPNYFAICGRYDGKPEQGVRVSVSKSVPINLGSKVGDKVVMGSTTALHVINREAPDLGPPTNPGAGKLGAFQLTTSQGEFTITEAKNKHIMIGIANSKNADIFSAMGTFTPYPNSSYQIQPQMVYHVATGARFEVGELVKVEQIGATMAVDFNLRGSNNVVLIHNENGGFEFE
ncbi:hypothetical protein N7517_010843 [Penicillium concentricum]|uniref:Uncharacterized protein n=1 Tax=Penicillium concentricum TaxID=293559 RepID=A0A9W9RBI1_9EURO|nr:uncharacterized protein N7517_010843 [Penicillium concentricum]KAJ5356234.1 hypothetical protein N7517_010843 [Penicillium concentricum]